MPVPPPPHLTADGLQASGSSSVPPPPPPVMFSSGPKKGPVKSLGARKVGGREADKQQTGQAVGLTCAGWWL